MYHRSYTWWQNNGYNWIEEINYRKNNLVYYHIQELILLDYFQNSNWNRILEFGCGFGRHLRYLREIPNLEVYGYDQSQSIVASMGKWAEPEWIAQNIKTGEPLSLLPYPDKYFDAVFTTSVFIHIPPEDVVATLKELARISKYQIIHQEPAPDYEVFAAAHDGCWNHDFVDIYKSIGFSCEILEPACEIQRLYRVVLDANEGDKIYTPSNLLLSKLYDLEKSIQPTINSATAEKESLTHKCDNLCQERDNLVQQRELLAQERDALVQWCDRLTIERNDLARQRDNLIQERDELRHECTRLSIERDELTHQRTRLSIERNELLHLLESVTVERNDLIQQRDSLIAENGNLAQQLSYSSSELYEIVNSRTWKAILKIKSNSQIKAVGCLAFNCVETLKSFRKPQTEVAQIEQINSHVNPFVDKDMENFLHSFAQQGKTAIAVYVPNWLGINFATKNMFQDCHPLPEYLTEEQAVYYANLINSAGVKHIIFAGVAPGHLETIKALYKHHPEIRCDITWHGSYIQNCEDYGWSMMTQAIALAKQGMIYKLGVAKKGMEKSFQAMGLRSEFLPNFVNSIPEFSSRVTATKPQLGIWVSWIGYRKLPYAMIAATHLVSDAVLNMAGVGDRAKEWADMLGVTVNYFSSNPIPREELHQHIKNTHLSLYLTSSECAPMLPIESLSLGVPCLISPVSHWFEDDEYLHSRLVVPYPERAEVIADYIEQALKERDEIIHRYKIYAERYNIWAKERVQKFLQY